MILYKSTFRPTQLLQSNNIIDVLENQAALSFVMQQRGTPTTELSLRYAGKVDFDLPTTLQLMDVYQRAKKKLPYFVENQLAIDKRSYEQSTSEAVAKYKTTFIHGKTLLDMTAGIGVDSLFLAKRFDEIIAVERNTELHEMASYNVKKLGCTNIKRVDGDSHTLLNKSYDWVYIDPDRRVKNARSVALHLLEPNVLQLYDDFRKYAQNVYIKLSPLFDIEMVLRQFEDTQAIYLLAEKGEVKEVGIHLNFKQKTTFPAIHHIDVHSGFSHTSPSQQHSGEISIAESSESYSHLLLPISLVAKSKAYPYFIGSQDVYKNPSFEVFYSNEHKIEGFRAFEVLDRSTLSPKKVKQMLNSNKISQANIIIKGLKEKPADWHKKLGSRDGGNYFLFLLKSKKSEAVLGEFISSKK